MTKHSTSKLLSLAALGFVCQFGNAQAQEVGKVISSTPVIQQVAVPRQVCTTEQVVVQGHKLCTKTAPWLTTWSTNLQASNTPCKCRLTQVLLCACKSRLWQILQRPHSTCRHPDPLHASNFRF